MELVTFLIDLFLHLDEFLDTIITQYGAWTYGILFAVIFVETGLVIMPFLPGDSLLFAAGTFAALGSLNVWYLAGLLMFAAIFGGTVNFSICYFFGNIPFVRHNFEYVIIVIILISILPMVYEWWKARRIAK